MSIFARWKEAICSFELSQHSKNICVLLLTAIVLSTLLPGVVYQLMSPRVFAAGEVASHTVRAPKDFLIDNPEGTERHRAQVVREVARVFTRRESNRESVTAQLDKVFSALSDLAAVERAPGGADKVLKERSNFEREFNIDFEGDEWQLVLADGGNEELRQAIRQIASPVLRKGIIPNKRPLANVLDENLPAVLRDSSTGLEIPIRSLRAVYDLGEAADVAEASFPSRGFGQGAVFDSVVKKVLQHLLRANVMFDSAETERRIQAARDSVETLVYRIKRGQVIVRAGEVVTSGQASRLQRISGAVQQVDALRAWVGYFVLSAAILLSVYVFMSNFWPGYAPGTHDLGLISCILVGSFLLIKLHSILGVSLSNTMFQFDPETFVLATPLAVGGILLQITLGAAGVVMFVLSFGLLSGVFLESSWIILMLIVLGNITGALSVKHCARRSAFIWAGLRVASVNMLIVACFLLLFSDYSSSEMANRVIWSIVGGLIAGVLSAGLTPVAEYFGRYITDFKLLELASLDQPLLRELSLQAPGTWNHSMVVGQIGEAAAEAIGANALLTRVAAYYHDIGKTKKPGYFVENQGKENRHDKLTPSMSALIIKKHVKDGVEMAEQHNLPRSLIDFIQEHHGTSLIEYFFVKAHKEAEEGEVISESHYRYAGPKPQTKESGILMLADAVEATSRTLADPTQPKIQGLVQRIINKVFASGELDESNLTLKDLHLIAKSFTRVLTGIYHRRVEYADAGEKKNDKTKANGNGDEAKEADQKVLSVADRKEQQKDESGTSTPSDSGKKTGESDSRKQDTEDDGKTLKRLGIS